MPKLIDADKLLEWGKVSLGSAKLWNELKEEIDSGRIDPTPVQPDTPKPGDKVNVLREVQFPFLQNVEVSHIEIHRFGSYAKLKYDGELYTIPCERLEVIPNE